MSASDTNIYRTLTEGLLRWYAAAARKLPWRGTQDPYPIFLSEIILQQTRVAQGLPYFQRFLETFPTVQALAAAQDDDVMRLWQGLGYYSRARNMLAAARKVSADGWPKTAEGLAELPGIGPYTAAAIASFAFGQAVPVLDGNVARVLSRWFDMPDDIAKLATQAKMRGLAAQLMEGAPPADFNQAMMEFGALQCVPGLPPCLLCPVRDLCLSFRHGTQAIRPVKSKAGAKRTRYLLYIAVKDAKGRLLIHRREGKGIWQGLYQFFSLEGSDGFPDTGEAIPELQALLSIKKKVLGPTKEVWMGSHVLSHQLLHIRVVQINLTSNPTPPPTYRWATPAEWEALGKPVPMIKATEALL